MTARLIRPPAVAGRFYEADPRRLLADVDDYLRPWPPGEQPAAVIVPHAGHIYSGPVAGSAYRLLGPARRVVLIGPSHFAYVPGIAGTEADVWRTPLGDVPIDTEAMASLPGVFLDEEPHGPEHCLEVQVPFLQRVLAPGWRLVPLLAGRAEPEGVAQALAVFLDDPETVTVISTDLSHYLPYSVAAARDRVTADNVVAGRWRSVADQDACGAYPLRGMLLLADQRELPIRLLDLRSSGDTAGPRDRVVGYGSFAVGA